MKKFFSLLTLALLTLSAVAQTTVTLDFATNDWGLPVGSDNGATASAQFTNTDGYTITLAASTAYYWNSNGFLMLGKTGSTLTFPAFDKDVKKIEVTGTGGASEKVLQNIYVGETAVSTETTGAKNVTNTYEIASNYQAAGTVYTFKVTSNHNTQISKIVITFNDGDEPEPAVAAPVFNPNGGEFFGSQEVTLTCATENASIFYWVGEQDAVAEWIYYKEPFYVTETTTYTAVATKGDDISDYTTVTFTKKTPQCAKPKFTPANGTTFMQGEELDVTINCDTEGATIMYQVNNGDVEMREAPVVVTLTESATITAFASAEGYIDSDEATATYTMVVPETTGPIFNLVTDVTTLADGDHIILVNTAKDGTAVAMGAAKTNNFGGVDVVVNGNQVQTEKANIITLVKNGDNWNLKAAEGYLYAASSSSNHMKAEATVDEDGNANAAISIADNAASIVFQGTNSHKNLRYNPNNGSPIFSCYEAGKQNPVYIYKTTEDVPEPPAPQYVDVNNFAEAYALESGTKVKMLNDAVVTYQNGSRLFVRDTEGTSGLIYGSLGKTFENGQVLGDEWTATYQLFNGNTHEFEILNAEEIFASGETRNAAPVECASISADIVNEYVILKGVTLQADTTANIFYTADNNIQICNFFNGVEIPEVKENSTYDVTGIVMLSKAGQVRVYVTEMTEVSSQTLVGDVDEDGNVNITDVTALIDMLLSDNTKPSGDVNGDGSINITDVTDLIDILLKN